MFTSPASQRLIRLVLDFDGTLTTTDTLAPLSQIGYDHAARRANPAKLPPWSDIVDAYVSDYKAHISSYAPAASARRTIAEEAAWLNSLQPIEQASANRAVSAGIWEGVTKSEVQEAATKAILHENVKLRRGWDELIRNVSKHKGSTIEVVSVNWSRWWIKCILDAGWSLDHDDKDVNGLDAVAIYSNELPSIVQDIDKTKKSPMPGAGVPLRTSGDKLQHLRGSVTPEKRDRPFTVYVGDSATDLECLVEADLGICIRDVNMGSSQKELAQRLARLDITVGRIGDLSKTRSHVKPCIVWANDFAEVEEYLQQLSTKR